MRCYSCDNITGLCRFNLLLSAEELKRAKNHLQKLWRALKNVDNNKTSGVSLRSASLNSVPDEESAITTPAEGTESRNVVTDELEEVLNLKKRPVEIRLEGGPLNNCSSQ